MNYETIEASILARLQPIATGTTEVIGLPETPKEFDKQIAKRRITVAVNATSTGDIGLTNEPVTSTGAIVQTEMVKIAVILEAKKLRGPGNLYELASVVRQLLVGFQPDNVEKMFLTDFGIADNKKESVWSQIMKFEAKGTIVEDNPDHAEAVLFDQDGNPLYPKLVQSIAESSVGESEVPGEYMVKIIDTDGQIYHRVPGESFTCLHGIWPHPQDVRLGIQYGPTGTEYTGLL